MKISRDIHNRCNAKFQAIKALDPDLAAQALARGGPLAMGTPAHTLMLDLTALSETASSFATGDRPRAAVVRRAMALIA